MGKDVWICAELKSGQPTETTMGLVEEGRRLSGALKAQLGIVAAGPKGAGWSKQFERCGADRIFVLGEDEGEEPAPETAAEIIAGLSQAHSPFLILFCPTPRGNDLASRIAAKLHAPMATGADRVWISDEGDLLATRLCCEQKIHETLRCRPGSTHVLTVEPGSTRAPADKLSSPEIVPVPVLHAGAFAPNIRIRGLIKGDPRTMDISDAEVIIAGGKGVEDNETFSLLWDLAHLLRAAVGGSRVAVDNGYIGRERQIGQSGKSISPELLISCGISGAQAHTAGMRDARTVVSINTDPNAPMMKLADLGVVGDLKEVIPRLIHLVRQHKGQSTNR